MKSKYDKISIKSLVSTSVNTRHRLGHAYPRDGAGKCHKNIFRCVVCTFAHANGVCYGHNKFKSSGDNMRCSGCGKDVPFGGQVCPYCQRDKSMDQQYTVVALIVGVGLGFVGYKIIGFWGAIIGFIAGCAIAYLSSGAGKSKPPEVSIARAAPPAPSALPSAIETTSEQRLKKLNDLRQKELIDDSEYAERRKAILDEL